MSSEYLLEAVDITKLFPGTKALDHVQLRVKRGEVHALCGENGAGKSTLMNIIGGVFPPTEGKLFFEGVQIQPRNPKEAQDIGIGFVHQELSLCTHLTAAENIYIGRQPTDNICKIRWIFMIIAVCDPKGIAIEAIKTILYHDKGLSDRISRIYEFWNMEQLLDASRDSSFDCIVFPNYCNSHNSVVCSLSCGYNRFPLVEHDPRYTLIVRDIHYWETARSLCLLLPVSAAIVGVWGSVFYTATFRILRQRTGGYHARTPHGCLLVSFVLQVLFSLLAAATKDLYVLTTVILLSEVAIFLLGPANHPELHLSAKELKAVKPRMYVRQATMFLAYVVALLAHQGMVASCIAMATFAVAVLLAVAHVDDGEIHRFKKEHVNQKEVIQNHE